MREILPGRIVRTGVTSRAHTASVKRKNGTGTRSVWRNHKATDLREWKEKKRRKKWRQKQRQRPWRAEEELYHRRTLTDAGEGGEGEKGKYRRTPSTIIDPL